MGWNALECIWIWDQDFHSGLSLRLWNYISGPWEISCLHITSYLVCVDDRCLVEILLNISSDDLFFSYEELTVECIKLHSRDLSDYHLWTIDLSRFLMLSEHYDRQRAQPTLRLHLLCFVVESCDVFVGNPTLFEPFGNSLTVLEKNESFWSSVDRF